MNLIRKLALFGLVAAFAGSVSLAMAADEKPVGTLKIDETQVMLLIGGDAGGGKLDFEGKTYDFKTKGLQIGGVGIQSIHLTGDVYDLKNVLDFPGGYLAFEASATFGDASATGIWLKNGNGVVIHLKASGEGVALDLAAEGLDIKF